MTSVVIDKSIGALLLGSYGATILFAIECVQALHYFGQRFRDPRPIKLLVGFSVIFDSATTLCMYACLYLYSVKHWGDLAYLAIQNWTIVVHLIATGITAAIVQSFMVYRYWRVTENHLLSVGLGVCIAAAVAGAAGTAADIVIHPAFDQRNTAGTFVTLWLVSSTAADVGIATTLLYRLYRAKALLSGLQKDGLAKGLVAVTVSTGTTTSIIAGFSLFAYLNEPQSNVFIGVTFLLGRVYSCTLLYTLNNRTKLDDPSARDDHCITFGLGGILIHREAVVVTDRRRTRSDTASALSIVVLPAADIASPAQSPLGKDFSATPPFADLPLIDEKQEDGQTLVRARHALDRRRSSDSGSSQCHAL